MNDKQLVFDALGAMSLLGILGAVGTVVAMLF
jgi:hypothetical protein